ncbi:hypothetical protein [Paenibacillus ehimensis]|uniref:Uncharacterized protein n=1 Tax=Paenibacillus ehimensis TaxID=79264 RepID=A0ABT8V9G6_9BACL|nr:hypothetical protein [Paenibacillus ehimensis]MDO3677584.1 hypothetical protein [Paenibacillus ehimensis]MEC0208862.1 hypothetical protein [Paenibacillus ehimensis]
MQRIATAEPQFSIVTIETTQYSRGFFERFGFVVERVVPGGFAPGFDLIEMELDLSWYRFGVSREKIGLD